MVYFIYTINFTVSCAAEAPIEAIGPHPLQLSSADTCNYIFLTPVEGVY